MTDVTAKPATRRREQTRARLLDAAHEVFAEVGMDAASVEMVCERAGFTRGAFYSNFESKDELFLALIMQLAEQKMAEVADRVREMPDEAAGDPVRMVRHIVGASFGEQLKSDLVSEIQAQAMRDGRMAEAFLTWQRAVCGRIEQIIAQVVETHGIRLRISVAEAAELLHDVTTATCTNATLEGCTQAEIGERLNTRLEMLVGALVEPR